MTLRDKDDKFVTITKVRGGTFQSYQVDGKVLTWDEISATYENEECGYELFMVCYELKLPCDLTDWKGGYIAIRKSNRLAKVAGVSNDGKHESKRLCVINALFSFLRFNSIKDKDGNEFKLPKLQDEFVEFMKTRELTKTNGNESKLPKLRDDSRKKRKVMKKSKFNPEENIDVNDARQFMTKKVSGLNFKCRKERFVRHKNSEKKGPNHKGGSNKIFAQQTDTDYLLLVSYRNKNETIVPDENRHALFFCGKYRNTQNGYVGDGEKEWLIEGDEGADDEKMQKLLEEIWEDTSLQFAVVNVWEIKKKG